jgi:hypothetical protein
VVTGLSPGQLLDFKVTASNFNGEGPLSLTALRTYSCVAPSGVSAPVRVAASSSATAVTLQWAQPESTGGCPITGYALFRSDPAQADPATGQEVWVEANSAYDTNIRDQPELLEATVTNFPAGSTGSVFKYAIEAYNSLSGVAGVGGTRGTAASYRLATSPAAPPASPAEVAALTSSSQITVALPALAGDAATGGSAVTSYALEWSRNEPGAPASFTEVSGAETDSLALQRTITGVVKGETYAFRYRAQNEYGWSSGWSPAVYLVASDAPAAPPAPTLAAATDTSLTVNLFLPADDGGQSLQSLELWRDGGAQDGSLATVQVTTYVTSSFSLQHQLTTTLDGIASGKVYTLRVRAQNARGHSEYSDLLEVGVVSPPA